VDRGFQVNRVPPGLLSLLDMKALGQNPVTLSEQLVPTLDLLGNYIASVSQLQDGNTTGTLGATGIFPFVVALAGPGELLIVSRAVAVATATLGAATTITMRGGVYDIASSQMIIVGPPTTGTTGGRPAVQFPEMMILAPGQGLALFVEAWTAGGVAFTMRFAGSIARLRV